MCRPFRPENRFGDGLPRPSAWALTLRAFNPKEGEPVAVFEPGLRVKVPRPPDSRESQQIKALGLLQPGCTLILTITPVFVSNAFPPSGFGNPFLPVLAQLALFSVA